MKLLPARQPNLEPMCVYVCARTIQIISGKTQKSLSLCSLSVEDGILILDVDDCIVTEERVWSRDVASEAAGAEMRRE